MPHFLTTLVVLIVIASVCFGVIRLFGKGHLRQPGGRRMKLIDRLPLGAGHTLYLVEIDETEMIILSGQGSGAIRPWKRKKAPHGQ